MHRLGVSFRWRKLIVLVTAVTLLGIGGGIGRSDAAPAAPAQTVPDWCQWIPPEFRQYIPECQDGSGGGEEPGGPVEEQFKADGPWAVTSQTVNVPGGIASTVFYPSDLGADGYQHPIITWGNGTDQSTNTYADTLELLASWGFVVVSPNTGSITPGYMVAGAEWLVSQDANPSSVFSGKLDTESVGAAGHSGGAAAASEVAIGSSLVTSVVPVALPNEELCGCQPEDLIDFSELSDPVFLMRGTEDWIAGEHTQTMVLDESSGPVAKAALVGACHGGTIFGFPFDCGGIDVVDNGFQGYLVAWFKYTLEGDQFAGDAFVGSQPELSTNSAWTNWASRDLP
jgi:hypothetical protein